MALKHSDQKCLGKKKKSKPKNVAEKYKLKMKINFR